MMIILNRETLEPPLIEVPLAHFSPVLAPPPHVRGADPLHELRKIFGPARPENQMPMVAHQAVGEDAHSRPLPSLFQDLDECGVVPGLAEDVHPAVAAIEHVKDLIVR